MSGSDYTTTPNLGLFKPQFNRDVGNWGTHWNQNADTLDSALATSGGLFLPLSGGVLSGPLRVPTGTLAAPSLAFGAADGTGISRNVNAMVVGVQNTMVLGMFAGSAQFYSPLIMLNNKITQLADATAAGDAMNQRSSDARYTLASAGPFLPLSGGTVGWLTLTGALTITSLPTTKPAAGSGIVWNNGGVLCVA